MQYKLKKIPHEEFIQGLKEWMDKIETLQDKTTIDSERLKKSIDDIVRGVKSFIETNVFPNPDVVVEGLVNNYRKYQEFELSHFGINDLKQLEKEQLRLKNFKESFNTVIGYLTMIKSLRNDEFLPVDWKISEKNDFILSQLNKVFGDETYSVERILKINGVKYRTGEAKEITEDLVKRGYLLSEDRYGRYDYAKISVKGARYIERKASNKKSKKDDNLDKKLDDVLERLTKLGYGQEIIFEEIEELRNLQEKLSKKSWGQLLKGKLIDLALDKVISAETAKIVYEYLTNGNFKLLGS